MSGEDGAERTLLLDPSPGAHTAAQLTGCRGGHCRAPVQASTDRSWLHGRRQYEVLRYLLPSPKTPAHLVSSLPEASKVPSLDQFRALIQPVLR